jgi:hypothetical protein
LKINKALHGCLFLFALPLFPLNDGLFLLNHQLPQGLLETPMRKLDGACRSRLPCGQLAVWHGCHRLPLGLYRRLGFTHCN